MVTPSKQLYYCHGACHEGGNAITFIKKIESVSKSDAVKILAKKAGLEVPAYSRNLENAIDPKKKERFYALLKDAARHYYENLSTASAAECRDYLSRRGLDEKTVKKFGLGYSINSREMITYLDKKGYTASEMKETGLASFGGDEGQAYDRNRGRLIFPVIDQFGEVVTFSGRTLEKNPEGQKYLHSYNTPVFEKSKTIYAVNELQKLKRGRNKIEYVILCEGQMDVIALHAAGFNTAVASLGTSLTAAQARQIRNFSDKVYVSYDGDAAGQKATLRSLDILESVGLTVNVVRLPAGKDPDDVIKSGGADGYRELLDSAVPLTEFKILTLKLQYNLSDAGEKAKFTVEAVRLLAELDPVEKERHLKVIHGQTGYSMDALKMQADIIKAEPKADRYLRDASDGQNDAAESKELTAVKFILASMAGGKPWVNYSLDYNKFIKDGFFASVAAYFVFNHKEKQESVASLYASCESGEENAFIDEVCNYSFIDGDDAVKYKSSLLYLLEKRLRENKGGLIAEFDKTKDMDYIKKIADMEEEYKRLKNALEI
jgi:DNA primase